MKEIISTKKAPRALGPYSQGVKVGNLIFTSGQIAIDPENENLISGDIVQQSERVFENIKAILESAGSSLQKVVKISIFMIDLEEFPATQEVLYRIFDDKLPAIVTFEANKLPKSARIMIEAIAEVS